MNSIDSKQAAIFIAVFSVIALLVNSTQGFGKAWKATSAPVTILTATEQASQIAGAEHAQYVARYLNGVFNKKVGSKSVAIITDTEDGKSDSALTAALVSRFRTASVQIYPSFFTGEFISDGLFKDALAGSSELFRKLDLANALDVLVLAQEDVVYSQNATLDNVTTATLQLKITVVPVSGKATGNTWAFTAYGPGFTKEVARKAAEERIIKQIASDTKMSLD
jgi:hypothetical protein